MNRLKINKHVLLTSLPLLRIGCDSEKIEDPMTNGTSPSERVVLVDQSAPVAP